ncbi:MAG: TIGR02647 family protein [Spongiibacter marinus]|jgi:uncharacterized protein (TIGR02647 family)|tara:strand:+ start:143 stop:472 length:330 start_codon:yes stop_codon:yes gene_type:complete
MEKLLDAGYIDSGLPVFVNLEPSPMRMSDSILQEIRVLSQFNPASGLEGIKVHHDADPALIAATERLFSKGIISRIDGGYLTDAGIELMRHLDSLTTVLGTHMESASLH